MDKNDQTYELHPRNLFRGFILDPNHGPVQSGRQAIQTFYQGQNWAKVILSDSESQTNSDHIKRIDSTIAVEDDYSHKESDAHYAHLGWPTPDSLPGRSWEISDVIPQPTEFGRWVTRRVLIQMWSIDLRADELVPEKAFVGELEGALASDKEASRFRALQEVLCSWGEMIPLAAIVGSAITATGKLATDANLEPISSFTYSPHGSTSRDLNSFIDTQLQIQGKFERVLKYHITGGRPDMLYRKGIDAWLESVKNAQAWEIIKITKVIPITDILSPTIQQRIKELCSSHSVIFRSPPDRISSPLEFDSTMNGLRTIQQILVGFSDAHIESLTVFYINGLIAGPFGRPSSPTRLAKFDLARGEFITDIFVWPTDNRVTSLQLVKNTGYVSPIYGATQGVTEPPRLFNGDGKALAGLSGSCDSTGVTLLQAVWRGDLEATNYRSTQTSFVGGKDGRFWNDLAFIGDRSAARILEIAATSPGTGYLSNLRATYTSLAAGYPVREEAPIRGTEDGQVTTWSLEPGEYIIGVHGRHDGTSICELQFTTNRQSRQSPAFGKPYGDYSFDFPAPKTKDGNQMALDYMVGKSVERVNSIMFVWANLDSPTEQAGGTGNGTGQDCASASHRPKPFKIELW